jgi:hypothetical protein
MKILHFVLFHTFLLLLVNFILRAQVLQSPSITISGDVAAPIELTNNDLSKFTHTQKLSGKTKTGKNIPIPAFCCQQFYRKPVFHQGKIFTVKI